MNHIPAATSSIPICSGISQKLMNFFSQKSMAAAKPPTVVCASLSAGGRRFAAKEAAVPRR
jgi:hypothetical protein